MINLKIPTHDRRGNILEKGCWYIYEDSPRALTSCILFIKHGVLSWDKRDGKDDADLLLSGLLMWELSDAF